MSTNTALRAAMAFLMFVLGNLQAWDSNVHEADLFLILVPGAMGLIFIGLTRQER